MSFAKPHRRTKTDSPHSEAGVDALPGLGPYSRKVLSQAGIRTLAELRSLGPVAAFMAAKSVDGKVSLNLLWGIAGALTGTHWSKLSPEYRETLLREYDAACDVLGQSLSPSNPSLERP